VGAADPTGAADALGVGEAPADGGPVGAGDELTVGEADGDVTAVGAAVGVALADGVAGTDMDGAAVAVGAALGVDLAGAELAGEVTGPGAACPECAPGDWCPEAARAMPPAADAASSPMTIDAIVSGRASRRRRRAACRPGPPAASGETGDNLADVTVPDGSCMSGSSRNVRVTASGTHRSVGGTALADTANSRSRAGGR
jgi:hypothetical protein